MNGQDPEVEPPRWSELSYAIYQWVIFGVAIVLGAMFFLLSIAGSLLLHKILLQWQLTLWRLFVESSVVVVYWVWTERCESPL